MTTQEQNFIRMLRSVMANTACNALTAPDCGALTRIAYAHKLSGMLFPAVRLLPKDQQPAAPVLQCWKQLATAEAVRDANQQYELERILAALEAFEIPAVPLKGFAIKRAYPQTSLRSMSDLDFLYDEGCAARLTACMQSVGATAERFDMDDTDIFVTETGLYLELHRSLAPDAWNEASAAYLSQLLQNAAPMEGCQYVRRLSAEDQYLYMLLHTLKHFLYAGTGIRSVLDVWALGRSAALDRQSLSRQFARLGIATFAAALEQLAGVWFGDGEPDDLTAQLGDYIAASGVYGNEENKVHAGMLRANNGRRFGRLQYALRRFFLPYREMCHDYPVLRRCPPLLPVMWLIRPVNALLHRRGKLKGELEMVSRYNPEQADAVQALQQALGLR